MQAFQRIALRPGEKRTVQLSVAPAQLATVQADGRRLVEPGTYTISVGGKQPGFHGPQDASTTGVVAGALRVAGPAKEVH